MNTDISVDTLDGGLKELLEQLPGGETVRLLGPDGTPLAVVVSLKPSPNKALSFEEWERKWLALADEVSKAWKSDKTALEVLAEMRR